MRSMIISDWLRLRLELSLAVVIILVALYVVSLDKFVLEQLPRFQEQIENSINAASPFPVELDSIEGDMRLLTPVITISGFRLYDRNGGPGEGDGSKNVDGTAEDGSLLLEIPSLRLEVDVLSTLVRLQPRLRHLYLDGMNIKLVQQEDGKWKLALAEKFKTAGRSEKEKKEALDRLVSELYAQKKITLVNTSLDIESAEFPLDRLEDFSLVIRNSGQQHTVASSISVAGEKELALDVIFSYVGDPRSVDELRGEFYANIRNFDWPEEYRQKKWKGLTIASLAGGVEVWGGVNQGRLSDISGSVDFSSLEARWKEDPPVKLNRLVADFDWEKFSGDLWELDVAGLKLGSPEHTTRPLNLFVQQKNIRLDFAGLDKQETVIFLNEFDLTAVKPFAVFLPDRMKKIRDRLAQMEPSGAIENLYVSFYRDEQERNEFKVGGTMNNVSILPAGGTPGINGLDGYFELTRNKGWLRLDSHNTEFHPATLFTRPVLVEKLTGDLSWQREDDRFTLASGKLRINNPDASLTALFIFSKEGDQVPELNLVSNLHDGDMAHTMKYIPDLKLKPGLVGWLSDAVRAGDVEDGGLLYNGPVKIRPEDQQYRTHQMRFLISGAEVKFLPDWPAATSAKGDVLVSGRDIVANDLTATIYDSVAYDLELDIPAVFGEGAVPTLYLTGKSTGDAGDGLKVLRETGLKKFTPRQLDMWTGKGKVETDLDLEVPLIPGHETVADVRARLEDASFMSEQLDLNFYQARGELLYRTGDGLSGDGIHAVLFEEPLEIDVVTDTDTGLTQATGRGKMDIRRIYQWSGQVVLEPVTGVVNHVTTLNLYPESNPNVSRSQIQVVSDLKEAMFSYPPPLDKPPGQAWPMDFRMTLGGEKQKVKLRLGNELAANLLVNDFGVLRANVEFGRGRTGADPEEKGIFVNGMVEYLPVKHWLEFLDRIAHMEQPEHPQKGEPETSWDGKDIIDRVGLVSLSVDDLDVYEEHIENAIFDITRDGKAWSVLLDSADARGRIIVPDDFQRRGQVPMDVAMEYVRYPFGGDTEGAAAAGEGTGASSGVNAGPGDIVPTDTVINELFVDGKPFGKWSFKSRPGKKRKEETVFSDLDFVYNGIYFTGTSRWYRENGKLANHFLGNGQARNVSDVLRAWGYAENIESSKAMLRADVNWSGLPVDVDYNNMDGDLWINIRNGRLLNVDSNTTIRALSIFNVSNITRRLQLDFRDITGRGVPFDEVKGFFTIRDAMLETTDMRIEAPSVEGISITGVADLEKETLDHYVDITLPTTITPVSCIFDPVGCAESLTNRQKREDLNTIRYHVRGNWSDPQVKETKGIIRN